MRRNDRSVGSPSRQSVEHFREARVVRITHGGFATGRNPLRMLDPQIVVNLLLEFGVRVDLMRHGNWPRQKIQVRARGIRPRARRECRTGMGAVSARHGHVRVLQRAARRCLRCPRRQANWRIL